MLKKLMYILPSSEKDDPLSLGPHHLHNPSAAFYEVEADTQ